MEYRPYLLGREWVKVGHNVTVVGSSESHVRTQAPEIQGRWTEEDIDGIRYVWIKTPSYTENGARRAINIFSFVGQLMLWHRRFVRTTQPDIVIASSTYPLDIVPARMIARRNRAKLIFEVHDLWPLSPIELGGMSPRHPFIRIMQWAENYAYCHADWVVSMLPTAAQHMQDHGMLPEKFVHIPNGIDVPEWEQADGLLPSHHDQILTDLKAQGRFLVAYAGAHGVANALDSVLDAAVLSSTNPITFVLVGQGPEKERLQSRAVQHDLTNVVFLPSVTRASIPSLLSRMDALLIGLQRQPLFRFGVSPNKLMDYMMAAKPVIFAIEAGNDPVQESGCGISIPAEKPHAILEAANTLAQMSSAEQQAMGELGRQYILANYDYRVLAQRFITLTTKG